MTSQICHKLPTWTSYKKLPTPTSHRLPTPTCWPPGTSQFILPFYPNQLFVWDVLEKNSVTCPLSMFRYIIFAILWKFLAKTLLLTNLQIFFFVYIIRCLNKPQCYRQGVYRDPLCITLKIKIWVVAYWKFIIFFQVSKKLKKTPSKVAQKLKSTFLLTAWAAQT